MPPRHDRRLFLTALPALALAGAALGGCALAPLADPPRVELVGLEGLPGEGMELRFLLRLRVQNSAPVDLAYDGVVVDLDLRGRRFASGVAPLQGTVPRYGEAVLAVPVTVSAIALARQLLDLTRGDAGARRERISYALSGRLGGGLFGGVRFSRSGEIDLGEVLR